MNSMLQLMLAFNIDRLQILSIVILKVTMIGHSCNKLLYVKVSSPWEIYVNIVVNVKMQNRLGVVI